MLSELMRKDGKRKYRIFIIGRTRMLYDAVLALKDAGHEIVAIITARAAPEYGCREEDFERLAKALGIPFILAKTLCEPGVQDCLKTLKADIGVSVNWVGIIDGNIVSCFSQGILNAHLGDIPRYRGNACANWAILNGESEVVLSIHFMEGGKLDCGRAVVQRRLSIGDDTYIGDIHKWANEVIPESFAKALDLLGTDQDYVLKYADPGAPNSFRCYPRRPEDGMIDWSDSAVKIHRLIRASAEPYAGAFAMHKSQRMTIWRASLVNDEERYYAVPGQVCQIDRRSGSVTVVSGDGKLMITEVSFDATSRIAPSAVIRSIRDRLT